MAANTLTRHVRHWGWEAFRFDFASGEDKVLLPTRGGAGGDVRTGGGSPLALVLSKGVPFPEAGLQPAGLEHARDCLSPCLLLPAAKSWPLHPARHEPARQLV